MKYFPDQAKVAYQSKYRKDVKEFSALEWMAALFSHIPDRGMQTVRYYCYCSNVIRSRLIIDCDHVCQDDYRVEGYLPVYFRFSGLRQDSRALPSSS